MARVFAYLMEKRQLELTDQDIFQDCSQTILTALQSCYEYNSSKVGITSTALELALKKLLNWLKDCYNFTYNIYTRLFMYSIRTSY